jgi:ABC-type transporter Mla subunit MlaD
MTENDEGRARRPVRQRARTLLDVDLTVGDVQATTKDLAALLVKFEAALDGFTGSLDAFTGALNQFGEASALINDTAQRLDVIMNEVQPIVEVLGAVSAPVNLAKSQIRRVVGRD